MKQPARDESGTDPRVARFLAACRAGDAGAAAAGFCPDAIYQEAHGTALTGRDALHAHFERFFASQGERWSIALDASVVEGAAAAVAYRFVKAARNGAAVERPGCAFVEFCGGLIHRWREYEG